MTPMRSIALDRMLAIDRLQPANDRLSRALAFVYAALDEVQATERTIVSARAQVPARTSKHLRLDEAADLVKRARLILARTADNDDA